MKFERRSGLDRRSGKDRRVNYIPGFYDTNGYDLRRTEKDRREAGEQRRGFALVTKWSSVNLGVETETLRPL